MIKIEITRAGDKVQTKAEFDINGTRSDADKKLFHDVLKLFVCEHIDETMNELEDGGEHDD